jgi:asparaginyl-tRNA synthetase
MSSDSITSVKIFHLDDSFIGKTIEIFAFVQSARFSKKVAFLKVYDSWYTRDSSKILQLVFDYSKFTDNVVDFIKKIQPHTTLCVRGVYTQSVTSQKTGVLQQQFELVVTDIIYHGDLDDPATYPFAGKDLQLHQYKKFAQHECKTLVKSIIYGIHSELMFATHLFFHGKGFTQCILPATGFSACEGGCQPFTVSLLMDEDITKIPCIQKTVTLESLPPLTATIPTSQIDYSKDFYAKHAYLTVSSQLELETQLALGCVYTITRAFRGEPSSTRKHLAEFSMVEIEMPFTRSAIDVMDISEEYIKFCIQYCIKKRRGFLETLYGMVDLGFDKDYMKKLGGFISHPFVRITHTQAVKILLEQHAITPFRSIPDYSDDLSSDHERWLVDEKFKHPVIVMGYPKKVKAFYMPLRKDSDEDIRDSGGIEHVDSFDILVPGVGELVGGSARIHNLAELIERIQECQLDPEPLQFYIDLRRKGTMPHGGMGLGFERLISLIVCPDACSVQDVTPFPRFYMQ